jgi:hypothetical protein
VADRIPGLGYGEPVTAHSHAAPRQGGWRVTEVR